MGLLVLVLALAACSDEGVPADRTVHGVIVDIESGEGFGNVLSFSVRENGRNVEIFIDPELDYEDFPLSHLFAHRAGGDPVIVGVEERSGRLYARSISDG